MDRTQMGTAAVVLLCSRCALADPLFFDDFDGDDLKPWWEKSPPDQWEYTVENGLLTVEALLGSEGNASMSADLSGALGDFDATVRMGWSPGDFDREIQFFIIGSGFFVARFWYWEFGTPDPAVGCSASNNPQEFYDPPPPGLHDFTVVRKGTDFHFLLDGNLLVTLPDNSGIAADSIGFFFVGQRSMGPLFVDSIRVVPAPPAIPVFGIALAAAARRRNRRP